MVTDKFNLKLKIKNSFIGRTKYISKTNEMCGTRKPRTDVSGMIILYK